MGKNYKFDLPKSEEEFLEMQKTFAFLKKNRKKIIQFYKEYSLFLQDFMEEYEKEGQ